MVVAVTVEAVMVEAVIVVAVMVVGLQGALSAGEVGRSAR
jgi:hypothetical protein